MMNSPNLSNNHNKNLSEKCSILPEINIKPDFNAKYAQLLRERLHYNKNLEMQLHMKYIFVRLIDNNPKHTTYNINEYYNGLINKLYLNYTSKQYSCYFKGAEWINEAFDKLYNGTPLILSLPPNLQASFKLLSLFAGENRYDNIAFALAKSCTSKTAFLNETPQIIKTYCLYNDFMELDKSLLDYLNLKDLKERLNNILNYWETINSNLYIPIYYGFYQNPIIYYGYNLLKSMFIHFYKYYSLKFNTNFDIIERISDDKLLKSLKSSNTKDISGYFLKSHLLQFKSILNVCSEFNLKSCISNLTLENIISLTHTEVLNIFDEFIPLLIDCNKIILYKKIFLDYRKTSLII